MKGRQLTAALLVLVSASVLAARGSLVTLRDYEFNVNGALSIPGFNDPLPDEVDLDDFDMTTGLGTIRMTMSGARAHDARVYLDLDIRADMNGFLNERGSAEGTPGAGQSWEIDEPGFLSGDILNNFEFGDLQGSSSPPSGSENDVALAMGWDFSLASYQTATLSFLVSEDEPLSGFYLSQTDVDEQNGDFAVFLSSWLDVQGEPGVPDNGTTSGLLFLAFIGLAAARASAWPLGAR